MKRMTYSANEVLLLVVLEMLLVAWRYQNWAYAILLLRQYVIGARFGSPHTNHHYEKIAVLMYLCRDTSSTCSSCARMQLEIRMHIHRMLYSNTDVFYAVCSKLEHSRRAWIDSRVMAKLYNSMTSQFCSQMVTRWMLDESLGRYFIGMYIQITWWFYGRTGDISSLL